MSYINICFVFSILGAPPVKVSAICPAKDNLIASSQAHGGFISYIYLALRNALSTK